MDVVVMGVGAAGFAPTSEGLSYREMIKRAATMAYEDAGIVAEQLDGAVSCEEDFVSGYSIADEYVPDQLGVVRKSVYTVPGDFLQGVGSAVMQLKAGQHKRLVVQGYCKASNILTKDEVTTLAFDPVFNRLGITPHYLAGIEMQQFLARSSWSIEDIAYYASRMREKALTNPLAPYGAKITPKDVLLGRQVATPVTEPMIARHADVAICAVLGTEEVMDSCTEPVFIAGTGWGSGTSIIERRDHARSVGTTVAARLAFEEAQITGPEEFDVIYVSDIYAHRAFMHLDALGIPRGMLNYVNPDGGSLGTGDFIEANGGARFFDAVRQLRGIAGYHQVDDAERALVHGWRGLPTDTCAVTILESLEGRYA
jgi:acetyl-CoA C-acetyltransferase